MNYEISAKSNLKEIYDSLVEHFTLLVGDGNRKKIAAEAKKMKEQLGKNRQAVTKEYITVLDKIIKDYTKKRTVEEMEKEYQDKKWAKLKK